MPYSVTDIFKLVSIWSVDSTFKQGIKIKNNNNRALIQYKDVVLPL